MRSCSLGLLLCAVLLGSACESRSIVANDSDASPVTDARSIPVVDARSDLAATRDDRGAGTDASAQTYADRVARACAIVVSCSAHHAVWPRRMSISQCIDQVSLTGWETNPGFAPEPKLVARLLACATNANCREMERCFGGDWIALSRCREGARCEGSRIVVAGAGVVPSFDCASLGRETTCRDLFTGVPRACCSSDSCPSSSSGRACEDGGGVVCMAGVAIPFGCAESGRTCSDRAGQAACAGTGDPCDKEGQVSCDGPIATICSAGRQAQRDCRGRALRSGCRAAEWQTTPCAPAGTTCDGEHQDSCRGSELTICLDGQPKVVDCAAIGFEICYRRSDKNHRPARCGFLL